MKKFLMGNEILAIAAKDAGAKIMFGYPITPTTEVLSTWIKIAENSPELGLKYLQTEDEGAAGFGVCGSVLAGTLAFTATSGPGNILMQDPIVMAEALRLPFVGFVGMRGGPSTGTVIYSQQEVTLTCFGGNSEGFRIVYSTSSLQDLYDYGIKVFKTAWKYRFPTFLLYDGYQGKMKGEVEIINNQFPAFAKATAGKSITNLKTEPLLKGNMRNIYNFEEELAEVILDYKDEFEKVAPEIIEYETIGERSSEVVIFAHGIVAAAAKVGVTDLQKKGKKVSLFRPITLWPFPTKEAADFIQGAKQVIVFESSLGQFARLIKDQIYWLNMPLIEVNKPGVGFTPEEIEKTLSAFL